MNVDTYEIIEIHEELKEHGSVILTVIDTKKHDQGEYEEGQLSQVPVEAFDSVDMSDEMASMGDSLDTEMQEERIEESLENQKLKRMEKLK